MRPRIDTSQVTPILEATGVSSGYGDIRVLWDASVTVWPGCVTVLLGANGAGKTTMLRAIAGLNPLSGGRLTFDGNDIGQMGASRRATEGIAYVMEGKRLFHRRTVEENLMLGGYVRTRSRRELKRRAQSIYDRLPLLGERQRSRAGELSGGQQQILAVGQALMSDPRVLLLDEPSGGLSPAMVKTMLSIVDDLRAEGLGVLLVEQAAAEALHVAQHVTVLDVGRVVLDRPASQIDDVAVIRSAYLGTSR